MTVVKKEVMPMRVAVVVYGYSSRNPVIEVGNGASTYSVTVTTAVSITAGPVGVAGTVMVEKEVSGACSKGSGRSKTLVDAGTVAATSAGRKSATVRLSARYAAIAPIATLAR